MTEKAALLQILTLKIKNLVFSNECNGKEELIKSLKHLIF